MVKNQFEIMPSKNIIIKKNIKCVNWKHHRWSKSLTFHLTECLDSITNRAPSLAFLRILQGTVKLYHFELSKYSQWFWDLTFLYHVALGNDHRLVALTRLPKASYGYCQPIDGFSRMMPKETKLNLCKVFAIHGSSRIYCVQRARDW